MSMPGGFEWLIILFVGILIFGNRLPTIARSLGRSVVEFKKGMKDLGDEVNTAADAPKTLDTESKTK